MELLPKENDGGDSRWRSSYSRENQGNDLKEGKKRIKGIRGTKITKIPLSLPLKTQKNLSNLHVV